MNTHPQLFFVAGPNGSGKSTFFEAYLDSLGLPFVNADRLALALGISASEAAAAADRLRNQMLQEGTSFITETVFSDPVNAKLKFLREAMDLGYRVTLFYIGIASPALSEARVAARVARGGHDVPSERLQRRYQQSLENLATALPWITQATVFDNSLSSAPYLPILSVKEGKVTFRSLDIPLWFRQTLDEVLPLIEGI